MKDLSLAEGGAQHILSASTLGRRLLRIAPSILAIVSVWCAVWAGCVDTLYADGEAFLFTPEGFDKPGIPITLTDDGAGLLKITVRDALTAEPTFCRINVVGADGNYYQPKRNYLTPFALTGEWPKSGKGNRQEKGPFRYYGRFFYSWGEAEVAVPPGEVRVEVWKGFEYYPVNRTVAVETGQTRRVELSVERTLAMDKVGYYSGDPHIHITQAGGEDESLILDLMEAEGIRYGSILAYNDPAGPYMGLMKSMDMPQQRGLGRSSIRRRGDFEILSGQEYRSTKFGHLNLFLRDDLVLQGQDLNADDGPPYGTIGRETQEQGGFAFYAHGGYAQSIYADFVQGDVNGVELLQFGVYRGIGLEDWYAMLNIGYHFPAVGACDYPACRKLGDCKTYVASDDKPTFPQWLQGAADGRSFVTTGPMLLLEVDGRQPGSVIDDAGAGPHRHQVNVRVASEVAPVTHLQLIVNGQVIAEETIAEDAAVGDWHAWSRSLELDGPVWIAARAYSKSSIGSPNAEAHTNPVYVEIDGKRSYDAGSIDRLLTKLDDQITVHKNREFSGKPGVLDYFERSRDILLRIRDRGGLPAGQTPAAFIRTEMPLIDNLGQRRHTEDELRAYLKPVPPRSPQEALETFETLDGFHIELVAAEPLVFDPIAAAFDEDGNLYVCEMRDYPYFPQPGDKPIGTVCVLRDTDDDGVFDESHVFARELLWAGGVAPWKGGVFVAAPPDIWYMRDTDGDFVADERRKVFTGFGTQNQQAMLNNLKFGLDHKIYGSTAGNGGVVKPSDQPDAAGVQVNGQDFRFDPVSGQFEAIAGTVQFGNSFDDWGNRFLCSESNPLQHAVLPQHYMARNPHLPIPRSVYNIAGGSVPIFRISPTERWRQIRSSRRIAHGQRGANSAGASHHVIDAGAGVTVYRGGAYPEEFYGNVFVGDAQNNLVHRRRLVPQGVTFDSERADEQTEFVRSSDNWFRPVNFVNAPDGTLYVLDMSREILESIHIPLDVVKFLDLKSGRRNGRIYRIAPDGFRTSATPRLGRASTAELVAALESPHGWWRETAHRLIYERQDASAAEPLRTLLHDSPSPPTRLHALWSLQGLGALTDDDVARALNDPFPALREHGVRLAEPRLSDSKRLRELVLKAAGDGDARVRFQVAFTLGETDDSRALPALMSILKQDADDPWMRAAVLSSLTTSADAAIASLLDDVDFVQDANGIPFLEQLARMIGAQQEAGGVTHALEALAEDSSPTRTSLQRGLVLALGDGARRNGRFLSVEAAGSPQAEALLRDVLSQAKESAVRDESEPSERAAAVELLGCFEIALTQETFAELLEGLEPVEVQSAVVAALAGHSSEQIGMLLLDGWNEYLPEVRIRVAEALLSRESWTLALLQAAQSREGMLAQIDGARRAALLEHRNSEIRNLAGQLLGAEQSGSRGSVIAGYRECLELKGAAERGSQVFKRDCAACHRIGNEGYAIGPDLTSTASRDSEALLMHILDPNRYVLPNYLQYIVIDVTGRSHTGMIASQNANGITLKRDKNVTETILRGNVEELVGTGKSLMPEGFEKTIDRQQMADLLAFLQSARSDEPDPNRPLDIGTEPGLVEPK